MSELKASWRGQLATIPLAQPQPSRPPASGTNSLVSLGNHPTSCLSLPICKLGIESRDSSSFSLEYSEDLPERGDTTFPKSFG